MYTVHKIKTVCIANYELGLYHHSVICMHRFYSPSIGLMKSCRRDVVLHVCRRLDV